MTENDASASFLYRHPIIGGIAKFLVLVLVSSGLAATYTEYKVATLEAEFAAKIKVAQDLRAEREAYVGIVEIASTEYLSIISRLTPVNTPGGLPEELLLQLKSNLFDQTMAVENMKTALGGHQVADTLLTRYQASLDQARVALDSIEQNDPGELGPLLTATHYLHENRVAMVEGIRNLEVFVPGSD